MKLLKSFLIIGCLLTLQPALNAMEEEPNYYRILDIPQSASKAQIDQVCGQKIIKIENELQQALDEENIQFTMEADELSRDAAIKQINEDYNKSIADINDICAVLGNPEKRRAYDERRQRRAEALQQEEEAGKQEFNQKYATFIEALEQQIMQTIKTKKLTPQLRQQLSARMEELKPQSDWLEEQSKFGLSRPEGFYGFFDELKNFIEDKPTGIPEYLGIKFDEMFSEAKATGNPIEELQDIHKYLFYDKIDGIYWLYFDPDLRKTMLDRSLIILQSLTRNKPQEASEAFEMINEILDQFGVNINVSSYRKRLEPYRKFAKPKKPDSTALLRGQLQNLQRQLDSLNQQLPAI